MKSVPANVNVALTSKSSEYSYTIPTNTRHLVVKARGSNALRIAFKSGDTADDKPYVTVPVAGSYSLDFVNLVSAKLYIRCAAADSEVAELVVVS